MLIRQKVLGMEDCKNNVQIIGSANTAIDGLRLLRNTNPDFILIDIDLPDLCGIDLIRYIKKHYRSTALVMITNHPNSWYRERCKKLGADYFLDPTQEPQKLQEILTKYIKSSDKDVYRNDSGDNNMKCGQLM